MESETPQVEKDDIKHSLSTIIQSLSISELSFTLDNLIKFTAVSVFVLLVLVYLFPTQVLIILLSVVFIVVFIIRVLLTSTHKFQVSPDPIDPDALKALRDRYIKKK